MKQLLRMQLTSLKKLIVVSYGNQQQKYFTLAAYAGLALLNYVGVL